MPRLQQQPQLQRGKDISTPGEEPQQLQQVIDRLETILGKVIDNRNRILFLYENP
jgi:hypothetical protein